MNNYFVYILKCSDNSFYTGITNDMEKRLINHNKGIASKYTRSRLPVSLIYKHPCKDKSAALKYEIAIKKLPRIKKEKLIKGLLSFEDIKRLYNICWGVNHQQIFLCKKILHLHTQNPKL